MIPYFHALFIQRHGMISALMIYGRFMYLPLVVGVRCLVFGCSFICVLVLQSSWRWMICFNCLHGVLRLIVVIPDHTHLLFEHLTQMVYYSIGTGKQVPLSQYVNWNKHPVPVPPSSRLIHYELQHSCVTSCRKSWCESWYSCNCEGPPIKTHFSIDLSNCYSYSHVIMYTCDCQFH